MHLVDDVACRFPTYIDCCVKLDDLVGHAPDLRGCNESGHFKLQKGGEQRHSEQGFLTVLTRKKIPTNFSKQIMGVLMALVFVALKFSLILNLLVTAEGLFASEPQIKNKCSKCPSIKIVGCKTRSCILKAGEK